MWLSNIVKEKEDIDLWCNKTCKHSFELDMRCLLQAIYAGNSIIGKHKLEKRHAHISGGWFIYACLLTCLWRNTLCNLIVGLSNHSKIPNKEVNKWWWAQTTRFNRSKKSLSKIWLKPFLTSWALYLSTKQYVFHLIWNTHLDLNMGVTLEWAS